MKRLLIFCICLYFFIVGCATGPINNREAFPSRNQDPRLGIIVNEGTAHMNLYLYDEAGRLIEQAYLAGVNRHLTINGQHMPKHWVRHLELGNYKAEIFPFYYQTNIASAILGGPGRYRIDLPKQVYWITVNRDPADMYYEGRHWGWIFRLNGGNIPKTANGLPGINLNFQGEAWKLFR